MVEFATGDLKIKQTLMEGAPRGCFSVEEVLSFQRELAKRWWGSAWRPHSRAVMEQIRESAAPKQALIHWAMAKLRDPALHTPETFPLTWPLFDAVKNPSSQMVSALRALLYSASMSAVCDDDMVTSTPRGLLEWVELWESAMKWFAKRRLLEYPKPHDARGRLLDVLYDLEAECLEFVNAGAERRMEIAAGSDFVDASQAMLVDPIRDWICAVHARAIDAFRKAHADKELKELRERRGHWLPAMPKKSRQPIFQGEIDPEQVKFRVANHELFYCGKRVPNLTTTMRYFLAAVASGEVISDDAEVGPDREGVKRRATALSAYTVLRRKLGNQMACALVMHERGLGFRMGAARYVSGERGHANPTALRLVADVRSPDPSRME